MSNDGNSNRGFWIFVGVILLCGGLFLPVDVCQQIAGSSSVTKGMSGGEIKAFSLIGGIIILGLHLFSALTKKRK